MVFRLLIVCTGNVCRSPMAAQLLRGRLGVLDGVEIMTAGTGALVGERMTAQAAAIARRLGASEADVSEHRARQLEPWMLREVDLVLALARSHRREILELEPSTTRRTFTLRELAHISRCEGGIRNGGAGDTDGSDERLRSGIARAAAFRGVVPPFIRVEDADVVDPYRRSDAVYEESAAQIASAVDEVGWFLRGTVGVPA